MKVFIDILVILLPVPLVLQLHMPKQQRLLVILLLSLGAVIIAAEAVTIRMLYDMYFVTYDVTWAAVPVYVPGVLEADIGLVCVVVT